MYSLYHLKINADMMSTHFRRAHRVSALVIFSLVLLYVALWDDVTNNSQYNVKRLFFSSILH